MSASGTNPNSSNTPQAKGMGTDPKASGDDTTPSDDPNVATCPNCGCQFDPKNPDAAAMPGKSMPDMNQGDDQLSQQIQAMMAGGK